MTKITKDAKFDFSINSMPHRIDYEPVVFNTQDNGGMAKFIFKVKKYRVGSPLSETVIPELALRLAIGKDYESHYVVVPSIVDDVGGILEYQLTSEQMSHDGEAYGELILRFNDTQSMQIEKFKFNIEKALLDEDSFLPIAQTYVERWEDYETVFNGKVSALQGQLDSTSEMINAIVDPAVEVANEAKSVVQNGVLASQTENGLMRSSDKATIDNMPLYSYLINVIGNGVEDDTNALQQAIDYTSSHKKILYIPEGTYFIKGTLVLKDNTHIILNKKAVLTKKVSDDSIKVNTLLFKSIDQSLGYGSAGENITIEGGIFQGDFAHGNTPGSSFHHISNLTLRNIVVNEAMINGHFADLMGCDNVLIENCIINGINAIPSRAYIEAIQIDNSSYIGAGGVYPPSSYDGLPTKNVIVQNCQFLPILNDDGSIKYFAPSAIGNHGQIRGYEVDNIKFLNNYIKYCIEIPTEINVTDNCGAVHFRGGRNISIEGNTFIARGDKIANASVAINLYTNKYGYSISDVQKSNVSSSEGTPNQLSNIIVRANRFEGYNSLSTTSINVFNGMDYNGLIYYIEGLTITDNTYINCFTESEAGKAVCGDLNHVSYVNSLKLTNNYVNLARRLLYATNSNDIIIANNNVYKGLYTPISVRSATNTIVSGNNFTKCMGGLNFGISSSLLIITNNTFTNATQINAGAWDSITIQITSTTNLNLSNNMMTANQVDNGISIRSDVTKGFVKNNTIIGYKTAIKNSSTTITDAENISS